MKNIKKVASFRQKSVIQGFDTIVKAIVSNPEKKQLLILVDQSTREVGNVLRKSGQLVGCVPAEQQQFWLEDNFDDLESFSKIAFVSSSDINQYQLADRLGFERTIFPDVRKISEDFDYAIQNAVVYSPNEIKTTTDFDDDMDEILNENIVELPGIASPFSHYNSCVRTHQGEVTGIGAWPGHGKSTISTMFIAHAILEDKQKVFWASMEMKSNIAIARMHACTTRKKIFKISRNCEDRQTNPERYLFTKTCKIANKHFEDRLYIYDVNRGVKSFEIMNRMEYARRRYGCTVFVIDSLTKCGCGDFDFESQKDFVDQVTDWSRCNNVMVYLIVHLRKGDGRNGDPEFKKPTRQDIAGAMAVLNLCSNGVLIWKNKLKEKSLENLAKGKMCVEYLKCQVKVNPKKYYECEETETSLTDNDVEKHLSEIDAYVDAVNSLPDSYLIIIKNRLRGIERDNLGLYFDSDCFRYSERQDMDTAPVYPWLLEPPQQLNLM